MIKNKIILLALTTILITACTSIKNILPSSIANLTTTTIPVEIQNAVSSRVNPETDLYTIATATISKSGSNVAQASANKDAADTLKSEIKREVTSRYNEYLTSMDTYSKSIVSPVISDLATYSTDLISKKITQKGAWEDSSKIYTLLSVPKTEIINISDKVLKDFIDNAAKKLNNISSELK